MTKNGNTLTYRVDQVEKRVEEMNHKIEELLTNHLPHIQMAIVEVKTKINVMTAINVGAIIIGYILLKVF